MQILASIISEGHPAAAEAGYARTYPAMAGSIRPAYGGAHLGENFMFGLTAEERKLILFLAGVLLLGIGINFLAKRYASIRPVFSAPRNLAKVDLNFADKDLLTGVPGIGDKLALRILERRRQKNGFSSIEELKDIKGIGDSKFERLVEYLYCK